MLNTLRFVSNDLGASLICFGAVEARETIQGDVQLARRLDLVMMPCWGDPNAAPRPIFSSHAEAARTGEATIEGYIEGDASPDVSPTIMLRLLLSRRMPKPRESIESPHGSRWLLHLVIPEFEAAAADCGIAGGAARSKGLPIKLEAAMFAGVAATTRDQRSFVRILKEAFANSIHFDTVFNQDPIRRPAPSSDIVSFWWSAPRSFSDKLHVCAGRSARSHHEVPTDVMLLYRLAALARSQDSRSSCGWVALQERGSRGCPRSPAASAWRPLPPMNRRDCPSASGSETCTSEAC